MIMPTRLRFFFAVTLAVFVALATAVAAHASDNQAVNKTQGWPWMNAKLSPDERADLVCWK